MKTRLRLLLGDRAARQRGSILSALLIIVAFLSILIGALMTELTSSFLISDTLVTRMQNEATVASAVELGIHQLQGSTAPPVCAQDGRGPWFLTLNGSPAAVTQACKGIVPDVAQGLASGAFTVDGVHDTTAGRDRYLVTDSAGRLRAYTFGQTAPSWSVAIGGAPTARLLPAVDSDASNVLLIPAAIGGSGCGGHCVALFNDSGGAPTFRCSMPASTRVTTGVAEEVSASGSPNFPDYAFFSGSGAAATLYVYDAAGDSNCGELALASLGGAAAGPPLVFPGIANVRRNSSTVSDEIFVLVSDGTRTHLQHWRYTETVDNQGDQGNMTRSLSQVSSLNLTNQLGGTAVGYAASSTVPAVGTNLTLAMAGSGGQMATARIAVSNGPSYTLSIQAAIMLPGAVSRPPYWCHCPGQDLIGAGSTNGVLYLLSPALAVKWSYAGQADGWPAINTTPAADSNGDWYFGAEDGYVYDVEIPKIGAQMVKAARFGPGGAIRSSPIVGGAADGCSPGPCMYFASSTAGSYFARLGSTRIIDLNACVSTASGSTSCAANPRLWARLEVGSPAIVGGRGVYVQGWSYYSP
jgi:hypothetical protein